MKLHIKKLLRESLLDEGVIELPREVQAKFGVLFDLIKTKLDDYKQKAANRNFRNAYKAFNDYFKLTDRGNKPLNVDVSLYDDPKDVGSGRMDTVNDNLLINLAHLNIEDYETFENILYHELVHAMDPLVRDVHVFNKYYEKKGAEPSGSKFAMIKMGGGNYKSEYEKEMEKYKMSQHEYTAFSSPLIAKIKKITGGDTDKLKMIVWVIENVKKYKTPKDLYSATMPYFKQMKELKLFNDDDSYWKFLERLFYDVKEWVNYETIYKKFLKDLYAGVTKTN